MSNPILIVTLGDPNGIGPEVAAKSAGPFAAGHAVVLVGPQESLLPWRRFLKRPVISIPADRLQVAARDGLPPGLYGVEPPGPPVLISPGRMSAGAARAAFRSFDLALSALKSFPARFALITGPVAKEPMLRAGLPFTGHTGVLGRAFGVHPVMLLMAGPLRVALLTEHIPLSQVPRHVQTDKILETLKILSSGLRRFGLRRPRLCVLGLNPHAGEGGLIGTEEKKILPAVRAFNRLNLGRATGPIPADSAYTKSSYDAYLALYHDQGLIPVKLHGSAGVINVTLGIPAVRTSPAHGTAYDIAGRGIADPRSMRLAISWAVRLQRQMK
ncbi:4-hydroxythreonine-4-phosphate dehydrogenase PdxA [bacterium]|nr:4-hydroxythreonine-4-phosphate dehydrogenase PdxA [bacterium]